MLKYQSKGKNKMKLNACKCGSSNLEAIKENTGIVILCKDCGNRATVPYNDMFIALIFFKLMSVAKNLQFDYLAMKWNEQNDGHFETKG